MGADMLVAAIPAPRHVNDDFRHASDAPGYDRVVMEVAKARIAALNLKQDRIDELADLFDEDIDTMQGLRDHALDAVHAVIYNYRDITTIDCPDYVKVPLWVTGGKTWGDDPTDTYRAMICVAELGIFDEPINDKEWEHALNATSTDSAHVDNDQTQPSPGIPPTPASPTTSM